MTTGHNNSEGGRFYGWYIVGALFFAMFLGFGTRQGFGIFVETWEIEWGVSVGAISAAASVGWLINGLSQPFFGRIIDRIGGRPVVIVSMTVMGIAFIAMAFVSNVWMLAVIYGFVISWASGGISPSMSGVFIVRWFRRKRGIAMSVLVSGASLGGLILVPFLTYLFLATNWQIAWVAAGVITLGLGVPLLWGIVRSDPSDMGLKPDGDQEPDNAPTSANEHDGQTGPLETTRWQDSFRSAPMWQLAISYWVCGITTASISVHFVRWASSEGITPGTAALAFGLLSGLNALNVILVGAISDHMQRKLLLSAVYLMRAVAFLTLVLLPGNAALWTFAILGGGSWLASVSLTTSLTADVYGVRNVGMLGGLTLMVHQFGGALAVILFGIAFDNFGNYDSAFLISVLLLIGAGILALSIQERSVSSRYVTTEEATGSLKVETGSAGG